MTRQVGYLDDVALIHSLLKAGLSVREVALKTGYSKSAIGRARRNLYGVDGELAKANGENASGAQGAIDSGFSGPNQEV
jgi:Trp operon repressor